MCEFFRENLRLVGLTYLEAATHNLVYSAYELSFVNLHKELFCRYLLKVSLEFRNLYFYGKKKKNRKMNNYNTEFSTLIKTFHPWDVGKWGEKENKTGREKN